MDPLKDLRMGTDRPRIRDNGNPRIGRAMIQKILTRIRDRLFGQSNRLDTTWDSLTSYMKTSVDLNPNSTGRHDACAPCAIMVMDRVKLERIHELCRIGFADSPTGGGRVCHEVDGVRDPYGTSA